VIGLPLDNRFHLDLVALIPRMRRFAYALTGSIHDGDELVQAACERALRNAERFRSGTRMDSWLYRIVQNLWRDSLRRSRSRGDEIDPDLAALSDHGLAVRVAEDRMTLDRVRALVAALPHEQRMVLALVAIEGLSYRDAAEVLDVPVGTVMSRLSRARARLAALIGEGAAQ
jgi:RNA polymerase sigma-70 factor, ECF subfamily